MNIAITGGSGLIGGRLVAVLGRAGHRVRLLSRRRGANLPPGVSVSIWDPAQGPPPETLFTGVDAVIHLAGENIAQRWTAEAKRRILDSRVTGTRLLVQTLAAMKDGPKALISASAIGFYGSRGDEMLVESSPPGSGFLPDVCSAWEREAEAAGAAGIRVVRVRIGVVLDPHGGALQKMLTPFRAGVGGRLGDGREWMSWIHLDDLAEMIRWAAETPVAGAVNGVAPNPVTNAVFTRELAHAVHRPAIIPVPGFALRALFGEMSSVLLGSQRVLPRAAAGAGFRFRFPELGEALMDLIK